MIDKCKSKLNRLDDIAISVLCMNYFPCVFDMFVPGMLGSDIVELLLNYCWENGKLPYLLKLLNDSQSKFYQTRKTPQMRLIRDELMEMFRYHADFIAFCSDYFPAVHRQFSGGMKKTDQITLLLSHCRRADGQWQYLAESLAKVKGNTPDVVIDEFHLPILCFETFFYFGNSRKLKKV